MTFRSLFTASALVALGMLFGRLLGLLREMLLAGAFGVGHEADMAILLLIIPDFITSTLVGGGASATLIPAFAARERDKALALMWQALVASAGLFIVIAAGILAYALQTGSPLTANGNYWAFVLFLVSLPLTAATSIITAWLQYRGRFNAPAFANAVFNGMVILALWLLPVGLPMLAAGICLATFIRLVAHVVSWYFVDGGIPASVFLSFTPWQLNKTVLKNHLTNAGTGLFSMFPTYAPYVILAAGGAGVATFNYAFKLILMPGMLGQSVIQMVLLPWLVQRMKCDEENDNITAHLLTLQFTWGLSLALCLSLSLVSHDIVALCFGHGRMTSADVDSVAHLFSTGVWALPAMLLCSVWQQMMYARGKPRVPFLSNALIAMLVVPACWIGNAVMGIEGIVLMYAVVQIAPVLLLVHAGRRLGMIAQLRPSASYAWITLAVIATWLPLAGLYRFLALPAIPGLMLGVFIGAATLAAGCLTCAPVRQQLKERLAHAI